MRRRYYGKKLPKVACIPFICPEKTKPTSDQLLEVDNHSYQEGEENNWWFVTPKELSEVDEEGLRYNLGTAATPERWIDVNLIEQFNKHRTEDTTAAYTCIPGSIAGYESYEHAFSDTKKYIVYETIDGVRKRTSINSSDRNNIWYHGDRELWIGGRNLGFNGRIYSINIESYEEGVGDINLQAIYGKGLVDTNTNRVVISGTTQQDENGDYIVLSGTAQNTGIILPKMYELRAKILITKDNRERILFSATDDGLNYINADRLSISSLYISFYPTSIEPRTIYSGELFDKVIDITLINSANDDDQYFSIESSEGLKGSNIANVGRLKSHTFTYGSTQRLVFVIDEGSKDIERVRTILPFGNAVWLYLSHGGTFASRESINSIRVIHRNPNAEFIPQISTNGLKEAGSLGTCGMLLKKIDIAAGQLDYMDRITSLYCCRDIKLQQEEINNYPAGKLSTMKSVSYCYINTRDYFNPNYEKPTSYEIILGADAKYDEQHGKGYYYDDEDQNALYYRSDSDNIHWFVSHLNAQVGTATDITDNEGKPYYKYKIKDGCTLVVRKAFTFDSNYASEYKWFIDFNDVNTLYASSFLNTDKSFSGTGYNHELSISELVIDTSININSYGVFKQTRFNENIGIIRFTNNGNYTINSPYNLTGAESLEVSNNCKVEIPNYIQSAGILPASRLAYNTKGERYINSRSYFPSYVGAKTYIGSYARKDNGGPYKFHPEASSAAPEEIKLLDTPYYEAPDSLVYDNGTIKVFMYYNAESSLRSFKVPKEYGNQLLRSYVSIFGFTDCKNLRVLDLSETQWAVFQDVLKGWNKGGYFIVPKTCTYTGAVWGDISSGKDGDDDNSKIHIFFTWDEEDAILKVSSAYILGAYNRRRCIVHVPSIAKQYYEEKGYTAYNDDSKTGLFYKVEVYEPENLETIINNYLEAIEDE